MKIRRWIIATALPLSIEATYATHSATPLSAELPTKASHFVQPKFKPHEESKENPASYTIEKPPSSLAAYEEKKQSPEKAPSPQATRALPKSNSEEEFMAAAFNRTLQKAEEGNPEAQFRVSTMLMCNQGCKGSLAGYLHFLQESAKQGYKFALNSLGADYEMGINFPGKDGKPLLEKDINKALECYIKAAEQDLEIAKENALRVMEENGIEDLSHIP